MVTSAGVSRPGRGLASGPAGALSQSWPNGSLLITVATAPQIRPTGKSSERSSWHLLGHESGSAAVLAAGTSQAVGKRLSGRLNGTSVAPEFTPKHNFELSDNRGRRPHDAARLEFGESQVSRLADHQPRFRLRAGIRHDAARVPARVRERSRAIALWTAPG
jgi:hypothetical protein